MARTRASAICAALLAILGVTSATRRAHAQTTLNERLRVQGIYSVQSGGVPPSDLALQVVPEVSLLDVTKRSQVRLTYIFAATADTSVPTTLSNLLTLNSAFDLSKRTSLILSADVGHSTVTNALALNAPANVPTGTVPIGIGQIFTSRVGEGITWEASSRTRVTQLADATYVSTIDAPPQSTVETYLANGVLSIDRVWPKDAIGIDFRGGYAHARVAPLPASRLIPLAVTPHWRHDISRSLTSLFVAGATVVVSPDPDTKSLAGPYAQASFRYLVDDSTFDLLGSVGTTANAITAQLLYADQVRFGATTVLSNEHHVTGSAGLAYTHGSLVELRRGINPQPDFDVVIADVGVTWSPAPYVGLFVRDQFVDQITAAGVGAAAPPALQRNSVFLGIQLVSRPDPIRVPTQFPQRVDGADAAVGTSSGTTPSPSSSGGGAGDSGSSGSGAPSSSSGDSP
jgi:hypothetical protein